jgi:hypothetical protein
MIVFGMQASVGRTLLLWSFPRMTWFLPLLQMFHWESYTTTTFSNTPLETRSHIPQKKTLSP